MLDAAQRQAYYEQLCEETRRDHQDPRRVVELFRARCGMLPGSDGRSKPAEFEDYERRYSGETLKRQFQDAALGERLVQLVRNGYSGVVTRRDDYDQYRTLCQDGWAKWRSRQDGVEFFPSARALAEMERGNSDDGSLDGLGSVPDWHRVPGAALTQPTMVRGTWLLAVAAMLWCTMVVGTLIFYQIDADFPDKLVSVVLIAITVGGGVVVYANLRPEVRSFVEDRLLSTANFAVIVSALVVPITANFFIRDYRQTQIQADLTKALMDHIGKSGEEGELSSSQLALMIDLVEKNEGKFELELGGFRDKLMALDKARKDEEAKRKAKEDERAFQDLRTALVTTESDKKALEAERERLKLEKAEKDTRMLKLNEDLDAARARANKRGKDASKAKAEVAGLEQQKAELLADQAIRAQRLAEIEQKSVQLEAQIKVKNDELDAEKKRAKDIEKARSQLVEKAAKDLEKYEELANEMDQVTKALGEAQGRETSLREEIKRLRENNGVLEQEVRKTVLYYSQRASQYGSKEGEKPSFDKLAELTAAKALQALEALEQSRVVLTDEEKELKAELKRLLDELKRKTTPEGGTEPTSTPPTDGGTDRPPGGAVTP
jgi:hypothetical protein